MKSGLSRGISKEQYRFLDQWLIFYVIGTAQETLQSTKYFRSSYLILKLDLVKAYDLVDWSYLRLLLLNAGLDYQVTQWILGCVSSTNYNVLVTGCPAKVFKGSRGLRQGCPLCPLLFLLVIEGMSRLLIREKNDGKIFEIKISKNHYLLFVDDVLLFGIGKLVEWKHFKALLDIFCLASGTMISVPKSCLCHLNLEEEFSTQIRSLFPFYFQGMDGGMQ